MVWIRINASSINCISMRSKLNEDTCKEYSPSELDRLVSAGYKERPGGFSCANCENLIYNQFCRHASVRAHVQREGCCIYWEGVTVFDPKKR